MKRCDATWTDVVIHSCDRSAHPHTVHTCPCGACKAIEPRTDREEVAG